ncbi:hypothetical protein [Catellatospora tritici]|uniref:hypothetical protein n=1 Tax=Catellatospora tritici TaxID=2851566 RepID=UPI001C2D6F28|nr:hypothetical protein [Catellatospora tritici]MBV1853104.1 hypothetical protein [Catellatospora tritici]
MEAAAKPSLDQVRRFHLDRLNDILRRTPLWGGETALRLVGDSLAFIDGLEHAWKDEYERLRARGGANALGVRGAFGQHVYDGASDTAASSVYAEFAWRHGWLEPDRTLADPDYRRLREEVACWSDRDHDLDEVNAEFGPPSVLFGPNGPSSAKTLAYAPASREQDLVAFHFDDAGGSRPGRSAVLLAVRLGHGRFPQAMVYTPLGRAYLDDPQ